uniref:DEP domain-containing protein n=1 Tax=Strongyloides papillosus TaxID=174720 RepID=A0A0N5BAH2_STREA
MLKYTIESSVDRNEYVSTIGKENDKPTTKRNPFKATTMWNDIENTFKKKMPLRKHRAYIWHYEDSFTGKEAIDFMIEMLPKLLVKDKEVSRESCRRLLQLFMDKKLFYNVRNEMDFIFRDGLTIYKFTSNIPEHNIKVKRSSSVNENTIRRISLRGGDIKARRLEDKVSTITGVPRPSLSHQDLSCIASSSPIVVQNSLDFKSSIDKNHHKQNISVCRSQSVTVNNSGPTSLNVLKSCDSSRRFPVRDSIRTMNIENRFTKRSGKEMHVDGEVRSQEDISSWRICILSFLREYLDPKGLSCLLPSHIDDIHVAFNCEKIGSKGIVKCFNQGEEMSSHVLKMMRFLARYPFDTKQFVDSNNLYVGIELDTYRNILTELKNNKTILPSRFNNLLFEIFKIYSNEEYLDTNFNNGESIFKRLGGTPLSRVVTRNTNRVFNPDNFLRNTKRSSFNSFEPKKSRRPIPFRVLQDDENNANTENAKPFKCDAELPGFAKSRLSCDLTVMEEMLSPYFSPNTARNLNSPYKGNNKIDDDILTDLFKYVLLLLPSQTRRKLHIIIRFMNRISLNHCLKLSKSSTNRIVILKTLTPLLIRCETDDDIKANSKLIAFIMDKESILFHVPEQLVRDRESYLCFPESAHIIRDKAFKPIPNKTVELPGFENIIHSPVQYCEKIDEKDFNKQAKESEKYLEDILNEYVNNKLFSETERRKKLKEFKKWYPEIYRKHFPDDMDDVESQTSKGTQSFVKRVRDFVRRTGQPID